MTVMDRRRALLMMQESVLDTSPVIAETGVYWSRTIGSKTSDADWCVTDWYALDVAEGNTSITLVGFIGDDTTIHTFQYTGIKQGNQSIYNNYYYFNNGDNEGTRNITVGDGYGTFQNIRITFSIYQSIVDDSYVYIQQTGAILFAGKNTIYYRHRNISEVS